MPIVDLGDGGWVLAAFDDWSGSLPWRILLGLTPSKDKVDQSFRMPSDVAPVEVSFTEERSKYLSTLYWVPPGPDGPKSAVRITYSGKTYRGGPKAIRPDELSKVSGRDIKLVSFVIEKTSDPLAEQIKSGSHLISHFSTRWPPR